MTVTMGACESCGAAGEVREPVHRLYLVPAEVQVDTVEQWCASCRSQYPHTPA